MTKTYSRQVQELSKEVQNNIKMDTEKKGSLRALRAELSNVTKQYDELSEEERRAAKGLELQNKIKGLTADLKSSEQETGRFYRNVGNYANGFIEAFTRMGGSMGKMQGPINVVKNGFNAISATPLIAILGALVSILQKVSNSLKSSEATMQSVTIALAPLNAGTRMFQRVMQSLGEGIAKVVEKLNTWADKLGLISEAMKNEQQLVKDSIALQKQEREVTMQNADSQLKVSELRAKAADKLNYSSKERVAFLEEALKEEEAIAKRELDLAKERYRIQEEQSVSEKGQSQSQRKTDHRHHTHAKQGDTLDAAVFSRAYVLTDEGQGGLVDGIHGGIDKAFEIACRRISRDDGSRVCIDVGLDEHVGEREHTALKSCGQANGDHTEQSPLIHGKARDAAITLHARHVNEDQRGRDIL